MAAQSIRPVTTPAGDPAWLVTRYETAKALLADPRLGRSHPNPERAARFSESAIFGQATAGTPESEQASHMWMRKLLTPSFSAHRISTLQPKVQSLTDQLLERLARMTPPADFHEAVSFPLPVLVICELLGVPYEDRAEFRRWSEEAADMTDGTRSRVGLGKLHAYMRTLLERKRRAPASDLLSDLAKARQHLPDGEEVDQGVATLAAGLLFAGHETTVNALDRGVVLLLTSPTERAVIERDPRAVPLAVEEILRHPGRVRAKAEEEKERAAGGIPRWANQRIDLDGVTIAPGDLVLLSVQDANLDSHRFLEPEKFAVAREQNAHLTFGHGPHFCIGAPLARVELRAVFGSLLQRFPTLRLAGSPADLRLKKDLLTGGLRELPVAW
jgi:cytochrome P450